MSRLVRAVSKSGEDQGLVPGENSSVRTYFENLGKYVPAEIIAGFTVVNTSLAGLQGQVKFYSLLSSFILFAVFTPVYFKLMATPEDAPALKSQQIVSFFAFLIWAYATTNSTGIFGKDGFNIYFDPISTALMVIFSFISGFIQPKK